MQTFLPYPSFPRSAAVLDDRRLGKQRVEVLQILRALHLEGYGWARHPAVLMWRGHTRALVAYGLAMVDEWVGRGHTDTTRGTIAEFTSPRPPATEAELGADELPPWLGDAALHRSHQAALVRKDARAYGAAFPDVPPDLPYVWPDPPAAAPPEEPFAGWVVRAVTPQLLAAFREQGLVGVPTAFAASTPKKRRQLHRLRDVARRGEPVVVPDGADLHRGLLVGPPVERELAGVVHLVRAVDWDRTLPRALLRRPYQLQDPQLIFALRGETAVRG